MAKKIFLTFSSKRIKNFDKDIETIIDVLDSSTKFKITYRWFESEKQKRLSDYEIYEKSTKALLGSDLVIAEASIPSTGVGQQIAFAMFHKIPVLVLAKSILKDKKKYAFLKGMKSTKVSFFYYDKNKDIEGGLLQMIDLKINDDLEKLNFMATKSIKKFLSEESSKLKVSQSELLRKIIVEWKENRA